MNPLQTVALLMLAVGVVWLLVTLGKTNPYPEKLQSAEELVNLDYFNNSSHSIANPDGGYVGTGETERSLDSIKAESKDWAESRTQQTYLSAGLAGLGAVLLAAAFSTSLASKAAPANHIGAPSSTPSDLVSRLAQLSTLREAGELSEAEYDEQRSRLLNEI
ncbi:hypothetical protein BH11ACT8_BH11ACT8_08660 [soil metagenome]